MELKSVAVRKGCPKNNLEGGDTANDRASIMSMAVEVKAKADKLLLTETFNSNVKRKGRLFDRNQGNDYWKGA